MGNLHRNTSNRNTSNRNRQGRSRGTSRLQRWSIILLCTLICCTMLSGCSSSGSPQSSAGKTASGSEQESAERAQEGGTDGQSDTSGSAHTIQSVIRATSDEENMDVRCTKILEEMTPEQKIGQMIMPSMEQYEDENGNLTDMTELNEEYRQAILEYGFGGIILFSSNMENTEQEIRLISDLQETAASGNSISGIPMFISIDQEGGSVGRIPDAAVMTGNMALAATGEDAQDNARRTAGIIGEEISSLGINMDFAPVMDVNNNPSNPVIGVRSFGSDPETVARLGTAFMETLQEKDIIPVLKHFPGHGDTDTDSHTGLPSIDKSLEELTETELVPFREAIDAGTDMIMTSHIQFPEIETETYTAADTGEKIFLPATLSRKMITGVLRGELGFDGVVITDSLAMGAISEHFAPGDVAELAINAGADILLMPMALTNADSLAQMGDYIQSILTKVQEGKIPQERIDESVLRILKLKMKYGILDMDSMDDHSEQRAEEEETPNTASEASEEEGLLEKTAAADAVIGSMAHHETEWEIMSEAVTLVQNKDVLPIAENQYQKVVFLTMNEDMQNSVEYAIRRLTDEGIVPEGFSSSCEILPMRGEPAGENTSGENISLRKLRSKIKDADLLIAISVVTSHDDMDPDTEDGEQAALVREAIREMKSHGGKSVVISSWLPYDTAIYQEADAILLSYGYQKMPEIPAAFEEDEWEKVPGYGVNLPSAICAAFGEFTPTGTLPVDIPVVNKKYDFTEKILYPEGYGLSDWGTTP